MRSGLSGDTPAAGAVRLAVAGSQASGRSQPTGTIHWYRTTTTAAATGHVPERPTLAGKNRASAPGRELEEPRAQWRTEATAGEANERKIEEAGKDADGRIDRENGGRRV